MSSTTPESPLGEPDPIENGLIEPDLIEPDLAEPPVDVLLKVVVGIAVLIGIGLRFAPRSGMWLDEALSSNIAQLPLAEIPSALRRDGHPPLFYVLLHVWTSVGGNSDWWIRAFSGVISVLTLPLMYSAGRRLAQRRGAGPLGAQRTGLIALAVTAVLPFGIRYGAEARMYALVMALSAAGYLLVDALLTARFSGTRRWLSFLGAALIASALLWTHYWSLWLLGAVGLVAIFQAWRASSHEGKVGARLLIGALLLGGLSFVPWLPTLLYQSAHTGTPWGERFGPASVVVLTIVDFAGAKYGIAHLFTYLLVPLLLLAALAVIQKARDSQGRATPGSGEQVVLTGSVQPRIRAELLLILLTMSIGWAAMTASSGTFSSRYASGIYPLFLLTIAAGIAVIRSPRGTALMLAVVVLIGSFGAVGAIGGVRSQTGQIAEKILSSEPSASAQSPSVVIACPDQLGVSLQRELELDPSGGLSSSGGLGSDVIPYPMGGDPRFVDWVDYADRNSATSPAQFLEEVAERIPDNATVYVVESPTYRTFEGQCDALLAALAVERDQTLLLAIDDTGLDESANLWAFTPRN
ncbi:Dolichyl-phosphate-mannose-protein mannosyltransferase [Actinobacteria bacterium IMCC26207]|nr:Dolichyl-phosphate-mannose-protein mannosyltransferase [Actinobacteria bacterium IMCC26207]